MESPKNEGEITQAEWDQLIDESQYYKKLIATNAPTASQSYQHILNNEVCSCYTFLGYAKTPDALTPKLYQITKSSIEYIKKYLKLIEDFPEFAEKELHTEDGCFPEIYDTVGTAKELIDAYDAKLRGQN